MPVENEMGNHQPVRLVRTGWCWKPAGTGKTSQHSSIQPAHMQPTGNPAHFKQMARTAQDVSSPEKMAPTDLPFSGAKPIIHSNKNTTSQITVNLRAANSPLEVNPFQVHYT